MGWKSKAFVFGWLIVPIAQALSYDPVFEAERVGAWNRVVEGTADYCDRELLRSPYIRKRDMLLLEGPVCGCMSVFWVGVWRRMSRRYDEKPF